MARLQSAAKAVAPATLTLVATLTSALIAGKFDTASIAIAVTGLVGSVVTYFVPNAQPAVAQLESYVVSASYSPDSALAPAVPSPAVTEPPVLAAVPDPPTPPAA